MKPGQPLTAALLFLALLACNDASGPETGTVTARLENSGLVAVNPAKAPVYYFAIERNAAAVSLWVLCTHPESCPQIPSGSVARIPYQKIAGWEPGAGEVLFFWWHLVPKPGGGFRPDSVRAVVASR